VQAKSAGGEERALSARARVFVSMLVELKNNKHRAKEREAAEGTLGRLQKVLRQLASSGSVSEPPPFTVKWAELTDADTHGRWWLVGGAWAGRQPGGKAAAAGGGGGDGGGGSSGGVRGRASKEEKLAALAQAQRMNTDLRRQIFVAIMGAEDYLDAHDRLGRLRLRKGQQPEVVRVLLECCGQEGLFNRFYGLLAARLCASHREIRFTLQFAFWDEFKALPESSLHRAANVAKLLAHVLSRGALSLGLLKVVKWHTMSQRLLFFWQVFCVELLSEPSAALLKVLAPLREPENAELRDGLQLFSARHLKGLIASKHAGLAKALKLFNRELAGEGA